MKKGRRSMKKVRWKGMLEDEQQKLTSDDEDQRPPQQCGLVLLLFDGPTC